jgi:hypothetical protein
MTFDLLMNTETLIATSTMSVFAIVGFLATLLLSGE